MHSTTSLIRLLSRRAGAAAAMVLLTGTFAVPQPDPNDPLGLGTKRGIQMMNQSGQVGTVTMFRRGTRTFVDVSMQGVPAGKVEKVAIHRNKDCDQPIDPVPAYPLTDLRHARSRTLISATVAKLVSGNYSVVIGSTEKVEHYFACGHLFH